MREDEKEYFRFPGDDITFTITLKNSSGKTADWYVLNEIVNSLEDTQKKAAGGAYSYLLTYAPSAGTPVTLFDSNKVGGELKENEPEGLHGVDTALKNYIALETMRTGKSGVVTLKVCRFVGSRLPASAGWFAFVFWLRSVTVRLLLPTAV